MRILLIGGNGFIWRVFISPLQRQGHSLALFHRGATLTAGVEGIRGNRDQLQASAHELQKFNPEVVIDLIVSSGSQAEDLMSVFRSSAARVVLLSSMDVYRAVAILHGTEEGLL